ncbi:MULTISPECIES: hypothetical protein [Kitasatospora]|uniref:Uncharacterized protein n=1 Tax=Kitasatospora setae (strain ATCC 33774 / DSM 43861 / JCM 3304 / KCC A-0304 / NBRC 14216 / KM-6054) TaxID=452652 RepID=E4N2C3_KITSK|nr:MULTISPECIES: hypothetical protein [Kitasatospora]BAJ32307.1 hypothetical protein KSE_65480 [Kitasatospora setae KM-6054]
MEPTEPAGGEPACFLHLLCAECGKVRENGRCPLCGSTASTGTDAERGEPEAAPTSEH